MVLEEAIARELLFPYLEKDRKFQQVSANFWSVFLKDLTQYEEDPKPLYALLYRLELGDPEKIIRLLPRIYDDFLEEIAEQYVRGNVLGIVQRALLEKNTRFREHLEFFGDLQKAMTRLQRRRMIEELPAAYAAISEEISDETISALLTKLNREQLREKFRRWEKEEEKQWNVVNEISFSTESRMEYSPRPFEKKEDRPFVPPPVPKPKYSLRRNWVLVVVLVVLIALIVWLLWR